jgi:hypothetical protein
VNAGHAFPKVVTLALHFVIGVELAVEGQSRLDHAGSKRVSTEWGLASAKPSASMLRGILRRLGSQVTEIKGACSRIDLALVENVGSRMKEIGARQRACGEEGNDEDGSHLEAPHHSHRPRADDDVGSARAGGLGRAASQ